MKPKRRNLTRWKRNRLRRLQYKLAQPLSTLADCYCAAQFNDISPASMARCAKQAEQLNAELTVQK